MYAGMSRKEAMYEIGSVLGQSTPTEVEVLRTGAYRLRHPSKARLLETWLQNFRVWTDWVTTASNDNIKFCGRLMRSSGGPRKANQFLALAREMRAKAKALGRKSIYRGTSWYEDAEPAYGQ